MPSNALIFTMATDEFGKKKGQDLKIKVLMY